MSLLGVLSSMSWWLAAVLRAFICHFVARLSGFYVVGNLPLFLRRGVTGCRREIVRALLRPAVKSK
jgi:hypothetical protein